MKIVVFILSLVLISLSCQNQSSPQDAPSDTASPAQSTSALVSEVIPAERFKSLMAETSEFQLIDVRTPEEYETGHIDGALNLNFRDAQFDSQLQLLDKTKPVFVYCQSGGRSGQAVTKMKALAFQRVYDLEGGFGAWSAEAN